jgi:hypothetical protein
VAAPLCDGSADTRDGPRGARDDDTGPDAPHLRSCLRPRRNAAAQALSPVVGQLVGEMDGRRIPRNAGRAAASLPARSVVGVRARSRRAGPG